MIVSGLLVLFALIAAFDRETDDSGPATAATIDPMPNSDPAVPTDEPAVATSTSGPATSSTEPADPPAVESDRSTGRLGAGCRREHIQLRVSRP